MRSSATARNIYLPAEEVVLRQVRSVSEWDDFLGIAFDHLHVDKLLYAGKPNVAAGIRFE